MYDIIQFADPDQRQFRSWVFILNHGSYKAHIFVQLVFHQFDESDREFISLIETVFLLFDDFASCIYVVVRRIR